MKTKLIIALVVVVAVVGGIFLYVTRPATAPSADVSTVTPMLPTGQTTSTTSKVYRISQTDSQAQFSVTEILSGSPFTAVGTTSQVAGDIRLDTANPSASQMGTIRVDARTLKTDSPARDGDIAHSILKTDTAANEFIDFKPTALKGMPARVQPDTSFAFEVDGDLTISGVTKPAMFTGTAVLTSGGVLRGTVQTSVKRSDYNLQIPNLSFVANVNNVVNVKAIIVANAVGGQ